MLLSHASLRIVLLGALCGACGSTTNDNTGQAGAGGLAGSGGGSGAAGTGGATGGGTAGTGAGTGGGGDTGGTGGTSGGTSGTGGAPQCNGPCGAIGCPPCKGSPMLSGVAENNDGYRIDTTEVTNEQYAEFLAAKVALASQPAECSWKTSFAPADSGAGCSAALFDPVGRAKHPVVCVDWCDARAYCEWAGKRLCMKSGGKPTDGGPSTEWEAACSASYSLVFPYGNTYDPTACNGKDLGVAKLVPVGSLPKCEGALSGLMDMSGNASEWTGTCKGTDEDAQCRTQGGNYKQTNNDFAGALQCVPGAGSAPARWTRTDDRGFRCCADPLE